MIEIVDVSSSDFPGIKLAEVYYSILSLTRTPALGCKRETPFSEFAKFFSISHSRDWDFATQNGWPSLTPRVAASFIEFVNGSFDNCQGKE